MADQLKNVQRIVEENGCDPRHLIAILQGIQAENNYLSEEALRLVAEKLGVSIAKVYSVATFYENFSLEAKGRHIIKVCAGTACHVRKSGPIYDAISVFPQIVTIIHICEKTPPHHRLCW